MLFPPVAVLYQAALPPMIDGARKPPKKGGYSDSGADIAYQLIKAEVSVLTPNSKPDPARDKDWVFADSSMGIQTAFNSGAKILWANTVLFSGHPIEKFSTEQISIVGQEPYFMQKYDNKFQTNQWLLAQGLPAVPSLLISRKEGKKIPHWRRISHSLLALYDLHFPLVIKPIRGRGSQGVCKVENLEHLQHKAHELFQKTFHVEGETYLEYGDFLMLEPFLPGQEITLAIMPPGLYEIQGSSQLYKNHWSLPIVGRVNHHHGIAPYHGVQAVMHNSFVLNKQQTAASSYASISQACIRTAQLMDSKAPIRIDCRESEKNEFLLFDVNTKPNLTGPGRPGRENQDSLIGIAAREIGWNYQDLLLNILAQSWKADQMSASTG